MAIFLRVGLHEFLDLISANMTEGIKQGPSKTFQSTPPVCFSLSPQGSPCETKRLGRGEGSMRGGEGKVYCAFCYSHHPIALIIFVAFVRTHPNLVFLWHYGRNFRATTDDCKLD